MPTLRGVDPDQFVREQQARGIECTVGGVKPSPAGATATMPVPKRRPADRPGDETDAPRRLVIAVDVPVRLRSEANAGGKLRDKIGRKKAVKTLVVAGLPRMADPLALPVLVTLTRYGSRPMDGDNLRRALKSVRDVVADWVGVNDGDKRIRFRYRQRAAWVPYCRIRIVTKGAKQHDA